MTETQTTEWRVVRILRVPADDVIHPTFEEAEAGAAELRYGDESADFATASTAFPLDGRFAAFTIDEVAELDIMLRQRIDLLAKARLAATGDTGPDRLADIDRRGELVARLRNEMLGYVDE